MGRVEKNMEDYFSPLSLHPHSPPTYDGGVVNKSIVDRMDKNWERVSSRKKVRKKSSIPLHYRSVEPYWTCMIHVTNNDKFDVKICTPRCHKQDIYCTVCVLLKHREKWIKRYLSLCSCSTRSALRNYYDFFSCLIKRVVTR